MGHVGSFGIICLDDGWSRPFIYFIWMREEYEAVHLVGRMFQTYQHVYQNKYLFIQTEKGGH